MGRATPNGEVLKNNYDYSEDEDFEGKIEFKARQHAL